MRRHAQRAFSGGGRRQQEDAQPSVAHLSRQKCQSGQNVRVLPPSETRWAALRLLAVLVQTTADRAREPRNAAVRQHSAGAWELLDLACATGAAEQIKTLAAYEQGSSLQFVRGAHASSSDVYGRRQPQAKWANLAYRHTSTHCKNAPQTHASRGANKNVTRWGAERRQGGPNREGAAPRLLADKVRRHACKASRT